MDDPRDRLRLRLLGPLEADVDGRPADLGGPRQRAVLGLMLVARGEVVSVDRIVEDLWRGEPPPRATGALQAYISNLRRALEPDRPPRAPAQVLVSAPPGYALRIAAGHVDAWRFETLLREAPSATDPVRVLREALALWRGEALAEYAAEAWAQPEAARLAALRLSAREALADALLRAGRTADAAVEAQAVTGEAPLREEAWRLLALAQYAAGQQADALGTLRRARRLLSDELGVDPGPRLAALERDVLAQQVELPQPEVAGSPPAGAVPLPHARPSTAGFVGREEQRSALRSAAGHARGADGRTVVATLAGEAGSGKSALLGRLAEDLRADGWRVVLGRSPESDGGPPAWAWAEALRALAVDADPGEHRVALAPLLTDDAPRAGGDALAARFHLHRAVGDWLAGITERPVAVLLDDVHRADAETRGLLAALLDRPVPGLFVVCAFRPDPDPGLEELLAVLARHQPTRVHLAGLDRAEVAALIAAVTGASPDDATVDALAERTDGNPFYVTESARLLASEGALVARAEVPEGVRDVLRRRFARLPEDTVSALRLAAVIGRDVDVALLVRAAEVGEDTVLDALEAGVISGLLVEPAAGTVRFSHLLVREALYAGIPRLRRTRWHQRVAEALRELYPSDLSSLAHHAALAATPATALLAAEDCAAAAGLAERRFAYDAAATLYRRALDCLDLTAEPVPPARRVALLTDLVRAQLLGGRTDPRTTARREAVAVAEAAGDDRLLIDAILAWNVPLPWSAREYGTVDEAYVARIERLLAGDLPTPAQRCRLLCVLVRETSYTGDPRTEPASAEAMRIARRSGDPLLLAMALHAVEETVIPDLDPARHRVIAEELLELVEIHDLTLFRVLAHLLRAQNAVATLDLEEADRRVASATELAERYQFQQARMVARALTAMLATIRGDTDTAEAVFAELSVHIRRAGGVDTEGIRLLGLVSVRFSQGRLPELVDLLEELRAHYGPALDDLLMVALLQRGDPASVARARALQTPRAPYVRDYMWTIFTSTRGLVVAQLGPDEERDALYDALLPYSGNLAGAGSGGFVTQPIDRVLGALARARGELETARAHFERARAVALRCGSAAWVAQAEAELASTH